MSFHVAFLTIGVAFILAWFVGVLAPAFSRGFLAIGSASALASLATIVLFTDIHYQLFDINGEYSLAVGLWAWLFLLLSAIGLTLGFLIRSKLRPFGAFEESNE